MALLYDMWWTILDPDCNYTLYTIGNSNNPHLYYSLLEDGEYLGFINAIDKAYNSNSTMFNLTVTHDSTPTAHMGMISSTSSVIEGEEFNITIYIDPIREVGGWQIFQLNFTQGKVNATGISPGSYWANFFDEGEINNDLGRITDIQTWTTGPYPDYNHTACIINFTALQSGVCTFEIIHVNVTDSEFTEMNVTTQPSMVVITLPPVIYNEYPVNLSLGVERPPAELNVTVEDPNGDIMDVYIRWKVICECCIQNSNCCYSYDGDWITVKTFTGVGNGTYEFIPLDDVTIWLNDWIWGDTTYTWSVNVTDGTTWTNETYQYTTGGSRYDVNNNDLVNFQDAGFVWVHRTSEVAYDGLYDVNLDGQVNFQDAGLTWINRD